MHVLHHQTISTIIAWIAFSELLSYDGAAVCCRLVCRIAELVGVYQISPTETKKLLLRMQALPVHLVSAIH